MSYATDEEVKHAESLGYSWTRNQQVGHTFEKHTPGKGVRTVWSIREGWQTADIVDNKYTNHMKFADLTEALSRNI